MKNSVLHSMAAAIREFEGWKPGSISYNNNNPGNLKYAGQAGTIGKDSHGHAIFDSYSSGWNALLNQLRMAFDNTSKIYNSSMTLYQFFTRYAEGNQKQYAEFVADKLGVYPTNTLEQLKNG